MVLQRWQSVFLFLAAIAMAVFTFMPVMTFDTESGQLALRALDGSGGESMGYLLLTLDGLITVLLLSTIFKYRDLKLQQRLCKICLLLIVALMACIAVIWVMQQAAACTLWCVLPLVALCFTFWASRRIKADRKLLSDSERIR